MAASSKRIGNLSSTFEKADSAYSISAPPVHGPKISSYRNIVKTMKTRIYRKKCVTGSENSKRQKKIKIKKPGTTLILA
jgi:hypothetical protein